MRIVVAQIQEERAILVVLDELLGLVRQIVFALAPFGRGRLGEGLAR